MAVRNRLSTAVAVARVLPAALRRRAVTALFNSQVRFAGTGGVRFEELGAGRAVLVLRNRRRVQNHIGSVHAAAMALLAETATGAVFGMNVPDARLPLLKSLHIDYLKRAQGDLRAVAELASTERERIAAEDKGEVRVPVTVTDASGAEPIRCELVWAWVKKK